MSSVDVIVPCYLYGHLLRECVESVLAQPVALCVLVIDDASPDDTAAVAGRLAEEDPRVTVVRHAANRGHIATYNEGLDWAAADYVMILSADDYLLPGALSRSLHLMDAHPDVGFAFGKAIDLMNGTEPRVHTFANSVVRRAAPDDSSVSILSGVEFFRMIASCGSINIVRTPTAVVRTALQKRLGGYRPELPHAGDLEMWLRLAAHAAVGVMGSYQAAYRFHGLNMQNSYYRAYGLGDILQRTAAVEWVFRTCEGALPHSQQLRRTLLRPLATEAVRGANGAFNDNDLDLAQQLSAFAINTDPHVKTTWAWRCSAASEDWVSARPGLSELLLPGLLTRPRSLAGDTAYPALARTMDTGISVSTAPRMAGTRTAHGLSSLHRSQARSDTQKAAVQRAAYSVLIRTFNCEALLPATLKSLAAQTHPPSEYVFVDSGSTDGTIDLMPAGAQVHRYVGSTFNYSEAINQGVNLVSTEYVLIISAHTVVGDCNALEVMVRLLESTDSIGAAYIHDDNSGALRHELIGRETFTGFNGLWNTCAVVRRALLRKRPFRPEVFAAEDQEWTRRLLFDEGQTVARFSGAGMTNNNPRRLSLRKRLNEYVAIAYFVNRDLLAWRHLARIGYRIVNPGRWPALRERLFNLVLLLRLLACRVVEPHSHSRYY